MESESWSDKTYFEKWNATLKRYESGDGFYWMDFRPILEEAQEQLGAWLRHGAEKDRTNALTDAIALNASKPAKADPWEGNEPVIIHPRYWTEPLLCSTYNNDLSKVLRVKAGQALGFSKARIAFHEAKRKHVSLWSLEDILRLKFLKGKPGKL